MFFVAQMCQLETHVVLNANEADIYVSAATDYRNLDYNDFSVEAYVNPAANPGPKAGGRKAAGVKSKAGMGKRKSKGSASRRPANDDDDSSSSSEEEIEAHAGALTPRALMVTPVASNSVAPRI